jgi:hypothetical protein
VNVRSPSRALSARTAALVVAVAAALALAVATAGPGLGFADDGGGSTKGVKTGKPAPAGTSVVSGTARIQPAKGVKPSATIPQGSTRDIEASTSPGAAQGTTARDVDRSDRGVKNVATTKDLGKKNVAPTSD